MKAISWLLLIGIAIFASVQIIPNIMEDHEFWGAMSILGVIAGFVIACFAHNHFLEEDWGWFGALFCSVLIFFAASAAATFLWGLLLIIGLLWGASKLGKEDPKDKRYRDTNVTTTYRSYYCPDCGQSVSAYTTRCPNCKTLLAS